MPCGLPPRSGNIFKAKILMPHDIEYAVSDVMPASPEARFRRARGGFARLALTAGAPNHHVTEYRLRAGQAHAGG